jgi:predicted nucleic acid-binding protein
MIWLSLNFDFFIAEPPVFKLQENSTSKSCYFSGGLPSHPFVRGELALGNLRQRETILAALDNLPQAPVAFTDEVNVFIEKHALYGLGIGLIDAHLLASTRLSGHTRLWTQDKRLLAAALRLNLAASVHND